MTAQLSVIAGAFAFRVGLELLGLCFEVPKEIVESKLQKKGYLGPSMDPKSIFGRSATRCNFLCNH